MKKGWPVVTLTCFFVLCCKTSWTQQFGGEAGSTGPTSSAASQTQTGQAIASGQGSIAEEAHPVVPAMAPLSGAEVLTPGFEGNVRSYLIPTFQWTGYGDTNPRTSSRSSKVFLQSTYVGSLTLQLVRKHSQLNLDYAGGAYFYSRRADSSNSAGSPPYGSFHHLGLFQNVKWRRWGLLLGDQGLYLPESPLGFSGFGGLGSFGSGLGGAYLANAPALNPSLQPDQSILTGNGRRLSNVALSQIQYNASPRSSFTATGAYGTLQFLDPGFINSRYWSLLTGYNHQLTPRDEISLAYLHNLFKFGAVNREMLSRGLVLTYGHKVAGRVSLQLSAGPVVNQIAKPLGGAVTRSFWSTYDSLNYHSQKFDVGISFSRAAAGGAGVLPGAETDLAQLLAGRRFLRRLYGSLDLSHAYSQSLIQVAQTQSRSRFEFWQAGANLSRELGQHISFYLNYYAQRQISNVPLCFGNSCTTTLVRQVGGVGMNWHTRPIKID